MASRGVRAGRGGAYVPRPLLSRVAGRGPDAPGPPARRALVLPVVCGLLLPHQPVAAHGAGSGHHAGGRRGAGRHCLQLLFHSQLGECGGRAWAGAGPGQGRHQLTSTPRQVALTVKALQRFRLGTDMSLFATEQLGAGAGQAYPGYPVGSGVEGTETYQSPPFTETLDTSPKGYQVPAY